MKYDFTGETKVIDGITLHQIRALRNLNSRPIKKGDLGGYIESETNLDQNGNAWVHTRAVVYGTAFVTGGAVVADASVVRGNARVRDNAQVNGNSLVEGDADVHGIARLAHHHAYKGNVTGVHFGNRK